MAEFDNEEVTRLKQWWDANGTALLIGILVGLVVIGGWQGWRWYENRQQTQAANLYAQLQPVLAADKIGDAGIKQIEKLENNFSSTPYAANAALSLAAYYVRQKEYDKAVEQLDWTIDNADSEAISDIARVRKARVVWTQGDPDAALKLLDGDHPQSFAALYAELEGDIHAAQDDRKAAYAAYQRALDALPPDAPRQPIETKRADNAPADAAPDQQETPSAS